MNSMILLILIKGYKWQFLFNHWQIIKCDRILLQKRNVSFIFQNF